MRRCLVLAGLLGLSVCAPRSQTTPAQSPPIASGVFYSQRVNDRGIPILSHRIVSGQAMLAARDRLELLLHAAPRLRRNLEAGKYQLHIFALSQFPSDLPEYRSKRGTLLPNDQTFDQHMIGGHISESAGHFSSCAEATLVPVVGHRLYGDETCIHELAHSIEWFALDASARARVVVEFRESTQDGRWRGRYGATNAHEWFAEITKYYFRVDRPDLAFYDPGLAEGREWLCKYDRRACEFAAALYSDRIDPGTPTSAKAQLGSGQLEAGLRSAESRIPVRLIVHNSSQQRIHLVWIDNEGKRDMREPFARKSSASPGEEMASFSWATHAFVVTDDAETALCTIVVPEEEAVVDISGPCR
jgi:hypothetical protein